MHGELFKTVLRIKNIWCQGDHPHEDIYEKHVNNLPTWNYQELLTMVSVSGITIFFRQMMGNTVI